jgi:hypothetical protein
MWQMNKHEYNATGTSTSTARLDHEQCGWQQDHSPTDLLNNDELRAWATYEGIKQCKA